jgi:murein DD-endopeptidase MepM/ murein hydrolase activator NlpD
MLRLPTFPRFAAVGILALGAIWMARGEWPWQRLADVPIAAAIEVRDPFRVVRDTLHSGETISTVLARQGVTGFDVRELADALAFDPRRIRADRIFSVHRDVVTDEPTRIEFKVGDDRRLSFIRTSSGWEGSSVPIRWTVDTLQLAGVIEVSLDEAVSRAVSDAVLDAGARSALVATLADVNAWSVDFSRDPQPGDPFVVVTERLISEEGEIKIGRILASDLTINGHNLKAFHFTPASGKTGYYDERGRALEREFLAAPVQYRYITGGVGRRFHPIAKVYRPHNGIDYSAATGTPVLAASKGVIVRAGTVSGYGRMVEIRHKNGITTRYAHLSRIESGISAGRSVQQGQRIGRVGSTGLSTAPHLHYEFRVNGRPRDPRTITFPAGDPLGRADMPVFDAERDALLDLLARGGRPTGAPILSD